MKNIKDKIFTVLAVTAILISAGAGSGIISNPDICDIPGVEQGEIPSENPKGDNSPDTGIDPDCDFDEDVLFDD